MTLHLVRTIVLMADDREPRCVVESWKGLTTGKDGGGLLKVRHAHEASWLSHWAVLAFNRV